MSVLRQISKSSLEMGASCVRSWRPKVIARRSDARNDVLGQIVPAVLVAEEFRDVDQDLVEERGELFGMDLEVVEIGAEAVNAELRASQRHPPNQARALVAGEVKPTRVAKVFDQGLEIGSGLQRQSTAAPASSAMRPGAISSSGKTKSNAPVAIAADGMPKNSEEASSCAMTVPPRCLIAVTPIAPSWPEPVRTTAIARSP